MGVVLEDGTGGAAGETAEGYLQSGRVIESVIIGKHEEAEEISRVRGGEKVKEGGGAGGDSASEESIADQPLLHPVVALSRAGGGGARRERETPDVWEGEGAGGGEVGGEEEAQGDLRGRGGPAERADRLSTSGAEGSVHRGHPYQQRHCY